MGVVDLLKMGGFKPEASEEGAFETLTGQYKCSITALRAEKNRNTQEYDRYRLELTVEETLEGTFGNKRKLWKTYWKDNEASLKKMVNDLFTAGITLNLAVESDAEFEAQFENCIGKSVFIRAWGWTPDKDSEGNEIPEPERKTIQQFAVKQEKNVKVKKATGADTIPF